MGCQTIEICVIASVRTTNCSASDRHAVLFVFIMMSGLLFFTVLIGMVNDSVLQKVAHISDGKSARTFMFLVSIARFERILCVSQEKKRMMIRFVLFSDLDSSALLCGFPNSNRVNMIS